MMVDDRWHMEDHIVFCSGQSIDDSVTCYDLHDLCLSINDIAVPAASFDRTPVLGWWSGFCWLGVDEDEGNFYLSIV